LMSVAAAGVFTACEDDIKAPEFEVPVATLEANTTILDLKTEFWDDAQNYIKAIGTKEDGSHYVVKGRVITSDFDGNIFKSLTIQDETAALTFSVNTYNLYLNYRLGQELVVDLTGLHIGKYNGLQQIGEPEWYEKGNAWEATFMAPQVFHSHVQLNGLPEPDKIVAHELASISDIPSGSEGLIKWQSQLVRLNNITFVPQVNEADGQTLYTFGIYHENFNQKVNLAGQELTLRTSGYSNFFQNLMPTEPCDMTCLLSYYGSDWQLMIIDYDDIENVGNPTLPAGEKGNPWTVDAAIEAINAGTAVAGWTKGYIVGTVAPEVTDVTSDSDIEWGDQATLANTVVIGLTPDTRDLGNCIIVPLPQDSKMREYVALRDHPENLGKELAVYGTPGTVLGTYGVDGNMGTPSEFVLEGVDVPGGDEPTPGPGQGDGTQASPYTVAQAIALGNPGSTAWVKGYMFGWVDVASISTGSHFEVPSTSASNVLIADSRTETDYTKCMAVQLVFGDNVRNFVNLKDNPGNLGKELYIEGTLSAYFNQPGVKAPTAYQLDGGGDTPTPPVTGDGDGTEAKPYSVSQTIALGNPGTTGWIEGYIVGWVDGPSISEGSHFEVPSTSASNVLIAESKDETDYTKCVPVQLVFGDNVRDFVNLKDNPDNLGKKLSVEGTLTAYFGQPGLKTPTAYKLDGEGGGDTPNPPTPPVTGTGDGSQTNPYTVDQVIALNTPGTEAWVEGVIVGGVQGQVLSTGATFEAVSSVYSNILLAPTADCKDVSKCVPVQLVAKTDIRAALNLGDNPGNLGKTVVLKGSLEKYFGVAGVKSPGEWELK
ncbi:MAG: hypothetical protein K2L62_02725, partial [Muribaculaceae bacterium]|nr:hypothetical protein [Muribaculaceae bacterium]